MTVKWRSVGVRHISAIFEFFVTSLARRDYL